MAAGLGFKDFTTGEVLTAADVDGYLMQGVWVFASAAARDAAVTSPQEGNFAYLKDTNVTTYYTGSAWANLDTTGMTNPMTTTGDMIYSSSGSTPARLGIGTANQQLRVNSGATAPEWFTPTATSSGLTLIDEVPFTSSATINVDNIFSSTYKNYRIMIVGKNVTDNQAIGVTIKLRASGTATSTGYESQRIVGFSTSISTSANLGGTDEWYGIEFSGNNRGNVGAYLDIYYPNLSSYTSFQSGGVVQTESTGAPSIGLYAGYLTDTTAYDGISFICSNNLTGAVFVYGYAKE